MLQERELKPCSTWSLRIQTPYIFRTLYRHIRHRRLSRGGEFMAPKLRKVEKEVLIPKYIEYKINHELCRDEAREFAECSKAKGLKVIVDCKSLMKKFEDCSNRWWRDEELHKQVEEEYIKKKAHFRKTGVAAEESPFKRYH